MSASVALSGLFLAYVLIVLPRSALRSARLLPRAPSTAATSPSLTRTRILATTLVSVSVLTLFAWATGRLVGVEPFARGELGARDVAAGAAVLAVLFGLMRVNFALRSDEERRTMPVYAWMPRRGPEWALFGATVMVAGVGEELAYRGVAMTILAPLVGGPFVAAPVLAAAFAVAHATQGWKTGLVVFVGALGMHALVGFTGTLVVAMAVHVTYDVIAGVVGSRLAVRSAAQETGSAG